MKNLFFILIVIFLAACTKEPLEQRTVQLLVHGNGTYLITYGTSDQVTVIGEDTWSTALNVKQGDNIQLSVKTDKAPATIYMRVEIQEGLLFCNSLYIEPQSFGILNHIVKP